MSHPLTFARPVVAADGALVAVGWEHGVWLLPRSPAEPRHVALAHRAEVVAVAPDSSGFAVAGQGHLTVLQGRSGASRWTTPYVGVVRRLALTGALVTAVVEADGTSLRTWRASDGETLASGPQWRDLEVDGLLVAREQALVWGRRGDDLDLSPGLPFARMCHLAPEVAESWTGEHLPNRPNGYLFPLADGAFGVFDTDSLTELRPTAEGWRVAATRAWDGRSQAAVSPSGTYAATLAAGRNGETDSADLQVRQWDDATVVAHASTTSVGGVASIAVDDSGEMTVAHVIAGGHIEVFTLRATTLTRRAHVPLR